ncbi:Zinc finger protein, partial [Ophiophagus hannah]
MRGRKEKKGKEKEGQEVRRKERVGNETAPSRLDSERGGLPPTQPASGPEKKGGIFFLESGWKPGSPSKFTRPSLSSRCLQSTQHKDRTSKQEADSVNRLKRAVGKMRTLIVGSKRLTL